MKIDIFTTHILEYTTLQCTNPSSGFMYYISAHTLSYSLPIIIILFDNSPLIDKNLKHINFVVRTTDYDYSGTKSLIKHTPIIECKIPEDVSSGGANLFVNPHRVHTRPMSNPLDGVDAPSRITLPAHTVFKIAELPINKFRRRIRWRDSY